MSQEQTAERARILNEARRTRDVIAQMFADVAWWNDCHPDEEPINPDPDGMMRRLLDGLSRMLADDTGEGPIPPVGGWMNPLFGRSTNQEPQ